MMHMLRQGTAMLWSNGIALIASYQHSTCVSIGTDTATANDVVLELELAVLNTEMTHNALHC